VDKKRILMYNRIMRKSTIEENKRCPQCGKVENQVKRGYNKSGTQRCECKKCGKRYTLDGKKMNILKRRENLL
jgi:transposase-like protein